MNFRNLEYYLEYQNTIQNIIQDLEYYLEYSIKKSRQIRTLLEHYKLEIQFISYVNRSINGNHFKNCKQKKNSKIKMYNLVILLK